MPGQTIDRVQVEVEATARGVSAVFSQLESQLATLKSALSSIDASKLTEVSKASKAMSVDTSGMTKAEKDISNSVDKIKQSLAGLESYKNAALSGDSSSLTSFNRRVVSIQSAIDVLGEKLKQLGDNRTGTNIDTERFQEYRRQLVEIQSALSQTKTQVADTVSTMNSEQPTVEPKVNIQPAKAGVSSFNSSVKTAMLNLKKFASVSFSKLRSGLSKLKDTITGVGRSTSFSSSMFGKILKYGFGIRSLYVLFRRLKQAIKDSFTQLQSSGAFYQTTKSNIDALKTSLLTLKYQFGAAFEPIFNAVAPALQTFINYLIAAMNTLSAFMAKITGKSTYSKVKSVTAAVAKNTGAAASNAKELNKQLQGFDKLNNLTSSNSGSGGSGSGSSKSESAMYETANVNDALSTTSGLLGTIFDAFKTAWQSKGKAVCEAAEKALKSIKTVLTSVKDSFEKAFKKVGTAWIESVLDVLTDVFNTISDIADSFDEAWNDDNAGEKYIESIFNTLKKINAMISTVTKSFRRAWNSGKTGKKIFENILSTITSINTIIGNLAAKFTEAWNKAGVGDEIMETILDIVEDVSDFIADIAEYTEEWSENIDFYPLLDSIKNALKTIKDVTGKILKYAKDMYNKWVLPMIEYITESTLPTIINNIAQFVKTIFDNVDKLYNSGIWDKLSKFSKMGLNNLTATLNTNLTGIADVITVITTELKLVQSLFNKVKNTKFGKWVGKVADYVLDLYNNWTRYNTLLGTTLGPIVSKISKIKQTFENLKNIFSKKTWKKWGEKLIDGIAEGMSPKQKLKKMIQLYKDEIIKWLKSLFGIHSPSTVMKSYGEYIFEGLIEGMKNKLSNVWLAVKALKDKLIEKLQSFFKNFNPWTYITGAWDKVKELKAKLFGEEDDTFTKAYDKWKEIISGTKEKAKEAWVIFKEKASDTWDGVKSFWDKLTNKDGTDATVNMKVNDANKEFSNTADTWKNMTDSTKTANLKLTGEQTQSFKDANTAYTNIQTTKTSTINLVGNTKSADNAITAYNGFKNKLTSTVYVDVGKAKSYDNNKKDIYNKISDKNVKALVTLARGKQSDGKKWSTVGKWVKKTSLEKDDKTGTTAEVKVNLTTTGTNWAKCSSVADWITKNNWIGTVKLPVALSPLGYSSVADWLLKNFGAASVKLEKDKKTNKERVVIGAKGGVVSGNSLKSIPQFASGTLDALKHGTIFAAGENGPEVMGHINGKTEILNRSQIASTVFSAITNGMRQFQNARFVQPPQVAYASGTATSYDTSGMSREDKALLAKQNSLLEQQNQLLQQIANKNLTISSRDVFNATRSESNNFYSRTGNSPFLF